MQTAQYQSICWIRVWRQDPGDFIHCADYHSIRFPVSSGQCISLPRRKLSCQRRFLLKTCDYLLFHSFFLRGGRLSWLFDDIYNLKGQQRTSTEYVWENSDHIYFLYHLLWLTEEKAFEEHATVVWVPTSQHGWLLLFVFDHGMPIVSSTLQVFSVKGNSVPTCCARW